VGFLQKDIKAGECGTSFAVSEKNLEYGNVLNLYEESDDGLIIRDETEWRLKVSSVIRRTIWKNSIVN
jgi:hypothetical protein